MAILRKRVITLPDRKIQKTFRKILSFTKLSGLPKCIFQTLSSGIMSMKHLTREVIAIGELVEKYHHPKAGALVLFSGEVRNHHEGRSVQRIEYEAHEELAEKMLADLCREAVEKFGLHAAHCIHRLGPVEIAESSVAVITSGSHRGETYEANRYIIDKLKVEVPIWKHEFFTEGDNVWH
jgi:molybdopterin synthase catalytic subunit